MRWFHATIVVMAVFGLLPVTQAVSVIEIVMEKTTYSYCEKLFYTIKISEITGNPAIVHIIDGAGKSSSAIPIEITGYETPVPSQIAFNGDIFPLGEYLISVEYAGEKTTAEFALVDSGKRCIPDVVKTFVANWVGNVISDGIVIDALDRYVDDEILTIPFQVTEQNIDKVGIPPWIKYVGFWWVQGDISDDEFASAFEYLIDMGIINMGTQNGI